MSPAALRAIADLADALARLAREAAAEAQDPHELLGLDVAAKTACTSRRVLRDAIRSGDLVAYGKERDRCVRRSDLAAWVESRRVRVRPQLGPVDRDIEARMARLARERRGKRRAPGA